ncbi:DNA polymerase I [Rubidibacter lacunae KORDI 51-2]|uniref:DNA polymerase I n=1 Tax=Rubidibacter lacunae KORDI 51-2 TaxID=582515 RepID=U5DNB1_9CHRO|nr:DNA polymerase I [Rubidibacter lacunae]ERN42357.1 DNA polymerase I [Rubidibacter lacunae KORDI 51-2]
MIQSTFPSTSSARGSSNPGASPLFLLIDGHSLAFRSYFAHSRGGEGGLRTSTGIPTSICYGFVRALLHVMEEQQPDSLAIAFDLDVPTFRHEADVAYKADRPETPEDFIPDILNLQELLSALNLPIVTSPGYEADDVLATIAKQGSASGQRVKIVSGDRDLFQLAHPEAGISVLYFDRSASTASGTTEFGPNEVKAKLGITPEQVVDYKALCGDKSDNIPGVKGIGEKTAVKLLIEYGTLDAIYDRLDEIKGATGKKLAAGREEAQHSRYLAQLKFDAPFELDLEDCKLQGFDTEAIVPLLEKLEMRQFLRQIDRLQQRFSGQYQPLERSRSDPEDNFSDAAMEFFTPDETDEFQAQEIFQVIPQIVDTDAKLDALIARLQQFTDPTQPVAWDTETDDLKPRHANLVGVGCCWGENPDEVAYIPIAHDIGQNLNRDRALEGLRSILEDPKYPKVLQNAKFDRLVFWHQGVKLRGVVFDPMLASYVLNASTSNNLTDLGARYCPEVETQSFKDLGIPRGKSIACLDIPKVAVYCGTDAYTTFRVVAPLRAELAAAPQLKTLFETVELPLEPVLSDMESSGVCIDTAYLGELSQDLEGKLQAIEQKTYAAAGTEFNLNSPKQLSEVLFERLNLDRRKSRKTKTGYSTDHATLEKLRGDHPAIDAMLEYRTLSKLKSTYVDALPELADPETQRIYTDFNQAVTSTGRLSSSNPNLQNIPIRTSFSRQIRKAFVPEPGWLLVAADYSQIELRILAHLSQEPVLLEAYRDRRDVHAVTAQLIFEKEEVTPDERRLGKTINFGIIYGMGAQRFAREAGVSNAQGKEFIDRYRSRYPRVFQYLDDQKRAAIARGYVETILHRRRYFTFESSRLQNLRGTDPSEIDLASLRLGRNDAESLRAAANAPIQGSSADIIKVAMVNLHEQLRAYQARLLLQVHDELVLEVPELEWGELQGEIARTMEEAIALDVPLVVEAHAGPNWMETKD